jgi:DNA repair protein RadC
MAVEIRLLESCPRIVSSQCLVDSLLEEVVQEKRELFGVVYLSTKNEPLAHEVISVGSLNASVVHPREIFRRAIVESAASLIIVHNHPSGDLEPSTEDKELTDRLVEAGKLLGIQVLDHLIVNNRREYYSFAGEGRLEKMRRRFAKGANNFQ